MKGARQELVAVLLLVVTVPRLTGSQWLACLSRQPLHSLHEGKSPIMLRAACAVDELRHLWAVHADVDGDAPHLLPHLGHLVHQVAGCRANCHTASAAQIQKAIVWQALQMVREAARPQFA